MPGNEKYIYIINLLPGRSSQVFAALFPTYAVSKLPDCHVPCKSIMFDQTSAILLDINYIQMDEILELMDRYPPASILLNCSLKPKECEKTVGAALSLFERFHGMYCCSISFVMQTYDFLSPKDLQHVQNTLEMFQMNTADHKCLDFSQNSPKTITELESHIKSSLTTPATKTDNKGKQQLRVDTSTTQAVRLYNNAHKPVIPSPLATQLPSSGPPGRPSASGATS
jgi:hypothetical protein